MKKNGKYKEVLFEREPTGYKVDGYESLAIAIIVKATQDYVNAKRRLQREPRDYIANATLVDCTTFFMSEWYSVLTKVDGRWLLKKLDDVVDNKKKSCAKTFCGKDL